MKRRAICGLAFGWFASLAGLADNPLADARVRIEKHRKSPLVIRAVNANGQPLEGVELEIRQINSVFKFGCNIFMWGRCGEPRFEEAYRERFARIFNFATLPFYWWSYEPRQGQTQAERIRQIADWCREHNIVCKGHPLVWNYADPKWLADDVDQVRKLLLKRVGDCVTGFARAIEVWDVVNEASQFDRPRLKGKKQTAMWRAVGQVELVRQAFAHARPSRTTATLLINDYDTSERYEKLIESLRDENGRFPFDVIGIQSHMHGGVWPTRRIRTVCDRFGRFGLPLHFTEVTILSGEEGWKRQPPWPSTPAGEQRQAEHVERLYTELFAHPAVEAITWWDFSDRAAWQHAPAGLVRKDMTPKPAYEVLERLITEDWRSQVDGKTDGQGRFEQRVFHGDYAIAYRFSDAQGSIKTTVEAKPSEPVLIKVESAR
jgi:endo-1,4-beta-xylanase